MAVTPLESRGLALILEFRLKEGRGGLARVAALAAEDRIMCIIG